MMIPLTNHSDGSRRARWSCRPTIRERSQMKHAEEVAHRWNKPKPASSKPNKGCGKEEGGMTRERRGPGKSR